VLEHTRSGAGRDRVCDRACRQDDEERAPDEGAETNRWLLFLVPPFLVSALFFTLAIGTKTQELIAPALFFGPMVIILGFIYLGLTSDSNSE